MKYLLDTHIWLWSLLAPGKLGKGIENILNNSENIFYLSLISVWETIILAEKKRIELDPSPVEWIKLALKKAPVKEAKFTNDVAIKSRMIKLSHKDPADRFIAATAWELNLTLITKDRELRKLEIIQVL